MDYALGKQLKDAGFPQKEPNGFSGIIAHSEGVADDTVYYPTLEELIEACAFDLGKIIRVGDGDKSARGGGERGGWEAVSAAEIDPLWCWAETIDAALARLWLALYADGASSA